MRLQVNHGHINLSRLSAMNASNVQTNQYSNVTDQQQIVLLSTQKDFIEHYLANSKLWDAEAIMGKRKNERAFEQNKLTCCRVNTK